MLAQMFLSLLDWSQARQLELKGTAASFPKGAYPDNILIRLGNPGK